MAKRSTPLLDTALLTSRLKRKQLQAAKLLESRHPHAARFFKKVGLKPGEIRLHATKLLTTGALTGTLLLTAPNILPLTSSTALFSSLQLQQQLSEKLKELLPTLVGPLTPDQEGSIATLLGQLFGIKATAELDGNRLNQSYGYIGAEQHLPRFPGDSIDQHDEYQQSGITPGRGAWGYFANSKDELTQDLIQKEKYYVAVQTLYLPDWNTRQPELKEWYKHRKVVVINPVNGKSVVAVIADSGPANWTGKHFGGSPEVMAYLGLNVGMQKGAAVLFFVDDPEGKIALGPVEYNVNTQKPVALR